MAEFQYLTFYKDHPTERRQSAPTIVYENTPRRQRGASECQSTLAPVMEHEGQETEKKPKRRFSLDFLFSRKRKESRDNGSSRRGSQRGSVESMGSDNDIAKHNKDNTRRMSLKMENAAEVSAWAFT